MGVLPYALSVHHFISTVGADAGFAAIIGLAILILLYFAQARETATLRDRFEEAAEHVRQLELRIAHLARSQAPQPAHGPVPVVANRQATAAVANHQATAAVAAPPPSPSPSRTMTPAPVPVGAAPSAPAGVGAPALSAATRLIPSGDEGAISIRQNRVPVGAAVGNAETISAGGGGVIAPPGPPPSTAAGMANGSAPGRPLAPPPPARASTEPPRSSRVDGNGPRPAAAPRRTLVDPPGEPRLRPGIMVAIGVAIVAAVVVALLIVTSTHSNSKVSTSTSAKLSNAARSARHRQSKSAAALKPALVTVAVLNGTATTNLAHDVSVKLGSFGYKPAAVATATDQTQTSTVVGYLPGQRRAALLVAHSLGLGSSAVQAVDPSNQAVACPQGAACTAQVVVTVGGDLANLAASPSALSSTTG